MLKRTPPWATRLLILAVFALGLALGVNALFSKLLAVDPARLAAASVDSEEPADATGAKNSPAPKGDNGTSKSPRTSRAAIGKLSYFLDPILKRNIFDSAAQPGSDVGAAENKEGGDELRKSELEVTLIAVAVASPASWSTALASVGAGQVQVYRIGDPILTAVVHDIQRPYLSEDGKHHPARLIVMREGSMEYIDAGGPAPKAKKPKSKADKKKKKKKKKKGGRHKWTGIRKVSDSKYTIDQSEVDYALGNLDKLSREARVVPNFQDGATNGFKVFSIRRNSALRKMGIKNNDVLTGVNNFDLSNTQKALEIYSKLQTEKSFRLDILRNGEPMTMEYDIQ